MRQRSSRPTSNAHSGSGHPSDSASSEIQTGLCSGGTPCHCPSSTERGLPKNDQSRSSQAAPRILPMRWAVSFAALFLGTALAADDNFTFAAVSSLALNATAARWLQPSLDIKHNNGSSICAEQCSNFQIDAGETYSVTWKPRGMLGWPFLPSPEWSVNISWLLGTSSCPLCGSNISCVIGGGSWSAAIPLPPCWAFLLPIVSHKVTVPFGVKIPTGGYFADNSIAVLDAKGHQRLELTFDLDLEGGSPG